ncbi:MAG: HAMP domain-containing histidine kinase [Lachnospiraceae bacterium]|nr:HAMP domain-containing histidine kinase [Lachnospiraceae bacterium]
MKRAAKLYTVTVLLYALLFLSAYILFSKVIRRNEDSAYVLMNRVFNELESYLSDSGEEITADSVCAGIDEVYYARIDELKKEYGNDTIPERVYFISAEAGSGEVSLINPDKDYEKLWALRSSGGICGFVVFEYGESRFSKLLIFTELCIAAAFLITLGVCIYIGTHILRPFEKLSSYPEKLSKNQLTEKLPETKNRFFGRFTWGINMLSDRLTSDRRRIGELSREHLTMLTTIAHGIKTPVSNIKLYADAISTGLYQPDGKVNESDAGVAEKISRNADEIASIVKELIDKAQGGVVDFEPSIQNFYLNELILFLNEEYGNRLNVLKIPHSFELESDAIIKSDRDGICRILSQLMENAIKYGNGGGINVRISKDEEGYLISVKNKGKVIPDKELPFLFNSFYRGSNSEGIPGSGIGLFECYEITRKLCGDIYARSDAENSETDFAVYLPGATHT